MLKQDSISDTLGGSSSTALQQKITKYEWAEQAATLAEQLSQKAQDKKDADNR